MRVAIISDIHGNDVALQAVLADLGKTLFDRLICLGDVATLGSQPCEVIDRLQTLDCQFILGNHEDDVLDVAAMERRGNVHPVVAGAVKWAAGQLSERHRAFLRTFHRTLEIRLDDYTTMLCFHGSPKSNTDVILASTPPDELEQLIDGARHLVLVGGHTHIQMLRRHKTRLVINPGSIGEPLLQMPPRDLPQIPPWAEYAVITADSGRLSVDLRRVPVDTDAIRKAAAAVTNPFNWADLWLSPTDLLSI